jgi:hypothetical protein
MNERPPLCDGCRANGWNDGRQKVVAAMEAIDEEREQWKAALSVTMETRDVLVSEISQAREKIRDAADRVREIAGRTRHLSRLTDAALRFHADLIATDLSRLADSLQ